MGLLDGILGSVMNSATGGGQQQGNNPLGGLLSSLGGSFGGNQGGNPGATAAAAGGGSAAISGGALLAMALSVVQSQGGVTGLLEKFRQGGLGQHVDSWVGTGANLPVSGEQVHQVLGSNAVSAIAAKLGVAPGQASSTIAQILPELINQLTPNGQVPANHHSLIEDGLKMLQGMTRS